MPHVGNSSTEDLASSDEIKVFKDEGDDEKRASADLTDLKSSLITEGVQVPSYFFPSGRHTHIPSVSLLLIGNRYIVCQRKAATSIRCCCGGRTSSPPAATHHFITVILSCFGSILRTISTHTHIHSFPLLPPLYSFSYLQLPSLEACLPKKESTHTHTLQRLLCLFNDALCV